MNIIWSKKMSDGGKGSKPRPVDQKKYESNWEIIFGKKHVTPEVLPQNGPELEKNQSCII